MLKKIIFILTVFAVSFVSCSKDPQPEVKLPNAFVKEFAVNGVVVKNNSSVANVNPDEVLITIRFSTDIDKKKIDLSRFSITKMSEAFELVECSDPKSLVMRIKEKLPPYEYYNKD